MNPDSRNSASKLRLVLLVTLLTATSWLISGCGNSAGFKATKAKALKGDAQAQLDLATMYVRGQEVKQNIDEAAQWCRKAAEQGLPAAQREWGIFHRDGFGTFRSMKVAREWLEKAAHNGDKLAQVELASLLGLTEQPFEYAEAMKWALIAEKNGATNAPAIIKLISASISASELSEARSKAEAFEKEK